jgi:hypothetical protein
MSGRTIDFDIDRCLLPDGRTPMPTRPRRTAELREQMPVRVPLRAGTEAWSPAPSWDTVEA